jgi:glycosyltransferase involved in cell wall biosynthesis
MKKNDLPLVTIGVASYNNSKYIIETLDSIVNQTYENIEIIINEDCSTDNSLEIINNWLIANVDCIVQLIVNEKNKGLCASLNNIIRSSNGAFISIIASDDRYLPGFVKNRVKILNNANSEVGMCYSKTYLINEKSEKTGVEEREIWLDGYIFEDLCKLDNSFLKPLTSMVKREVYDKIGLFDETLLYEDLDFFFRLSKVYKVTYIDSVDTEYRIVVNSLGSKLNTTVGGLNSSERIIRKNFGVSPFADIHLAKRLRKVAVNKRKMNIKSWREDFKLYLRYVPNLRDKVYLIVFSIIS